MIDLCPHAAVAHTLFEQSLSRYQLTTQLNLKKGRASSPRPFTIEKKYSVIWLPVTPVGAARVQHQGGGQAPDPAADNDGLHRKRLTRLIRRDHAAGPGRQQPLFAVMVIGPTG